MAKGGKGTRIGGYRSFFLWKWGATASEHGELTMIMPCFLEEGAKDYGVRIRKEGAANIARDKVTDISRGQERGEEGAVLFYVKEKEQP